MGNLAPYIILFLMVVAARLITDRFSKGSEESGTYVSAETQSPAQPVVKYENPLDQYLQEHYPNARR